MFQCPTIPENIREPVQVMTTFLNQLRQIAGDLNAIVTPFERFQCYINSDPIPPNNS